MEAARHTHELERGDFTQVLIDGAMGPLGSNSCGPEPLAADRLYLREARCFRFILYPADRQCMPGFADLSEALRG